MLREAGAGSAHEAEEGRVTQLIVIPNWLPAAIANGAHGHWGDKAEKLAEGRQLAHTYARFFGVQPIAGKARLTAEFVFPERRRRDADNLTARLKGVIDGLRDAKVLADDDTDHLEIAVKATVVPGTRELRLTLTEAE
ncbi:MAG: hypothetical protein KGL39_44110 [Patescibacteria group bacterium]|nr:hypothetical protein [Patescibacteria group bacterium]